MSVYFVTGSLGSGKGLASIHQLRNYAENGLKIAGNIDIFLDKFIKNPQSKISYTRLPDKPTVFDLECLGSGNDTYDPENNGLIVLDELATWFNSRSWQDKGRAALIDWFVHSRKHGWDILFLCQSFEVLDKQLIELLMEYHVPMNDLSKINIPIIGKLLKPYTKRNRPVKFPKYHFGRVLYKNEVKADFWQFKGSDYYPMYDTKQVFTDNYQHGAHSLLSRWHNEGRYIQKRKYSNILPKILFAQSVRLASWLLYRKPDKFLPSLALKH